MATKEGSTGRNNEAGRVARTPIGGGSATDALALLKADHEEVSGLLEQFDEADDDQKQDLAMDICRALTVHARIEEEIFYPAAREELEGEDLELLNEADVEHGAVKQLIAQIEALDGSDKHFNAMVTVLGEYVKHHVAEEENELFPKLEASELDLADLGQQLMQRKAELIAV